MLSNQVEPRNKNKLIGQKAPLRLNEIWAIRVRLELEGKVRDLALFNMAIDSKLRACDLVRLRVADVTHGNSGVLSRTTVVQRKTGSRSRPEPERQSRRSSQATGTRDMVTCSVATFGIPNICLPSSTRESCMAGWSPSVWNRRST